MSNKGLICFNSGALAVSSLSSYISLVHQIPMLAPAEEFELAVRYQEKHDLKACWKLVLSHLRLVVSIARGYADYGLSQADLIQEGNIGLLKAVKRFNPTEGRLAAFAKYWISAEIHEFVIKNWRIVKVATTKARRKLFFKLRQYIKTSGAWFNNAEVKKIAHDLAVPMADVVEVDGYFSGRDQTFDLLPTTNNESSTTVGSFAPVDYLEDEGANPEMQLEALDWQESQKRLLKKAIDRLDARSKYILVQRWLNGKKMTLKELSEQLGISIERVNQIQYAAMKKIRGMMESDEVVTNL